MENGVLRNHFRVECEPHFFSPHGQANRANFKCTTKTSILIYNLINQNTRQVCGYQESTRTSDKFVGTKMWDITAVFSPPALCSSILTWLSSTAPALQLLRGIIPGRTPPSQADAASTMAQRSPAFLEPRSPPLAGPPCLVHPTPLRIWEHWWPRWGDCPSLSSSCSLCWETISQSIILTTKGFFIIVSILLVN